MPRSIDFSRATASAICSNSSLLALTAAMALVSSGGIDIASPQSVCRKAVLLVTLWCGLLLRLQSKLVALRQIAFRRMLRWWRLKSEALAQLTFRRLASPHRFRDQLVGQNQPGLGDILQHQHDIGIFAGARVLAM